MAFDKSLLYYFFRDALAMYSEDFRVLDRDNPTLLKLNEVNYSVHVSYVHDSGNNRPNQDEERIQISRNVIEEQRKRKDAGMNVAFIGFFEGGKAFVAWEPEHVFSQSPKASGSVYARRSHAEIALEKLAAAHVFSAKNLGRQGITIALPPRALGFYLENIERFHRLPNEASIVSLMEARAEIFGEVGLGTTSYVENKDTREKFTYERKAYPRDPRFKKRIMDAYGQTCCVCNRQLGLIQAAHIIPHSEVDSPNTVQNGLAMCIEHHRLYDDALLLPGPDQQLVFNDERAEYLKQTNQDRGLDGIAALAEQQYRIPDDAALRPSNDFLQRGLNIRLGG